MFILKLFRRQVFFLLLTVFIVIGLSINFSFADLDCAAVTDVTQDDCEKVHNLWHALGDFSYSTWGGVGDSTPTTMCDWQNLYCQDGHIHSLYLSSVGASGTINNWADVVPTQITTFAIYGNPKLVLPTTWEGLPETQSFTLDLNNNNIDTIPNTWSGLSTTMNLLKLTRNNITTIPSSWDSLTGSIRTINLDYNNIDIIPNTWEGLNDSLDFLYLNYNNIVNIPNTWSGMNDNLRRLYLYNNNIENIPNTWEGVSDSMEHLLLYNNQISNIPSSWTGFGNSLLQINFTNNNITTIPDSWAELPDSITMIRFLGNNLSSIPDWAGLPESLTELNFSNNFLTGLDWAGLPSGISKLIFSNNQIETIPDDWSTLPSTLTYLTLPMNNIESIPSSWAGIPSTMASLDLGDNQISEIPDSWEGLEVVTQALTLSLDNNQIFGSLPQYATGLLLNKYVRPNLERNYISGPLPDYVVDYFYSPVHIRYNCLDRDASSPTAQTWISANNQTMCDYNGNIGSIFASNDTPTLNDPINYTITYTKSSTYDYPHNMFIDFMVSPGLTINLLDNPGRTQSDTYTYTYDLGILTGDHLGETVNFAATVKGDLKENYVITNTGFIYADAGSNIQNGTRYIDTDLIGGVTGSLYVYNYFEGLRDDVISQGWMGNTTLRGISKKFIFEYDNTSNADYNDLKIDFLGDWNIGNVSAGQNVTKEIYVVPYKDKEGYWKVSD